MYLATKEVTNPRIVNTNTNDKISDICSQKGIFSNTDKQCFCLENHVNLKNYINNYY